MEINHECFGKRCPGIDRGISKRLPAAAVCGFVALKRGQRGLGVSSLALAVVGLLGIVFVSQQINQIIKDPFAPNALSGSAPPVVTLSEYELVQEGMAYGEVSAIIGTPGREMSRSELASYTTVMYSWTNPNGSNMNAMFQNGKLVNKAQFVVDPSDHALHPGPGCGAALASAKHAPYKRGRSSSTKERNVYALLSTQTLSRRRMIDIRAGRSTPHRKNQALLLSVVRKLGLL